MTHSILGTSLLASAHDTCASLLSGLSAIPYITAPEKTLVDHVPLIGPLKLQVFGPLVATGVILGWYRGLKWAREKGMDEWLVRDYMWWQLVAAFVMAHWISVIFYFPEQVKNDPWVLLAFWNGLSSVGGFFGGLLGAAWFTRKHKQPLIPYLDLSVYGLLLGWVFGRLGCSLVHDHPGKVTSPDFVLAVGPWPDGTYRYDLGLYEFLFAVAMTTYVHGFARPWTWRPGRLLGLVVVLYAPFRFAMDFLRADAPSVGVTSTPDLRYMGLTTAQWFTVAFFIGGIYLLFFRKPRPEDDRFARPRPPEGGRTDDDAPPGSARPAPGTRPGSGAARAQAAPQPAREASDAASGTPDPTASEAGAEGSGDPNPPPGERHGGHADGDGTPA